MKIVALDKIGADCDLLKKMGHNIVLTAGVFDLFHIGHAIYLDDCVRLGSVLVVGVNSDSLVRKMKGPSRPIIPEQYRAELISYIHGVDLVTIFDDIGELITQVKPHVLVISQTTKSSRNEEKRQLAAKLEIEVVEFADSHPDVSTSKIIAKIKAS